MPAENRGANYTFPHLVPDDSAGGGAVGAAFPWMDEITLQFALDGVKALSSATRRTAPTCWRFRCRRPTRSGTRTGPDSREMHDQILRLDRSLGVFLDSLFKLRDRRRVVVALTADHGMTPLPAIKSTIYPNHDAKVVSIAPQWRAFRARLAAAGVDSTAVSLEDGAVVVVTRPDAFARADVNARFGDRELREGRAGTWTVCSEPTSSPRSRRTTRTKDMIARRWLHMFAPGGAARLVITLTPYSYWAPAQLSHTRLAARQRRTRADAVLRRRCEGRASTPDSCAWWTWRRRWRRSPA